MKLERDSKAADLKRKIGENIRKIRLNNNVEVKRLCSDLAISPAAYSNIERGVTDINISRIMQLADYFAVHYSQILAVGNTIIHQFSHTNNESTRHNQQIATMNVDSYTLTLQQIKEENQYLREQNNKLLDKLVRTK